MEESLKCGICLDLFQDPRSLPCLHMYTFCRECIQRSLNEENHSLKCPVCRAKHDLSEGVGLLPVNQYALQELPLKRLKQQREDNGEPQQLVECKSCGEQTGPVVALCEDCDGVICRQCFDQHKKRASLRKHHVEHKEEKGSSINLPSSLLICLKHAGLDLRFLCTSCYELVCSDCLLLGGHKHHQYILASEARPELETMMEEFDGIYSSIEGKQVQ